MNDSKLKWGIIGLGKIANKFAEALQNVEGVELYAVASRSISAAQQFSAKYGTEKFYGSYLELINDSAVDVIYVATPHGFHKEHTILCLNNKKPVLCEKPLAHKLEHVKQMIACAIENNTFLMEAMWTRFLPSITKTLDLINEGVIGEIKNIEADFGFNTPFAENGRLYDMKLGGGSLMDVGVYPLFLVLTILGKPISITAKAELSSTGADVWFKAQLNYSSAQANIHSSIIEDTNKVAKITGTKGEILIQSPWYRPTSLVLNVLGRESETIDFGYVGNGFEMQIKEVKKCLQSKIIESDRMPHSFSLLQSEVLDEMCTQTKIIYP